MYLLYIFPLSSTIHDFVVLTSLTHPKISFGCAANRKTGNRKSQRLISTPM
jgi:hypothetical protein